MYGVTGEEGVIAPIPIGYRKEDDMWRKSTHSGNGGNCVEVSEADDTAT